MGSIHKHTIYNYESQPLSSPIKQYQRQIRSPTYQPPLPPTSDNGFPILAIAVLCIMAISFLIASYYIFLSKFCFRWQQLDPLHRFSSLSLPPHNDDPFSTYSPSLHNHRLNELLISEIPTFQYPRGGKGGESTSATMHKCVVCLNEFQEQEMLRILPKCGHGFHLDCIDIWLQSNANCPICRSSISGERKYPVDRIVAPTSSPQDPQPFLGTLGDEDFVVTELTGTDTTAMQPETSGSSTDQKLDKVKFRKFHHVSIMGDECIDVRERDRDDQFSIQPIRRSFSMDSAADPKVYLAVQKIIRQNAGLSEVRNNQESSSRVRRSFFPFGHGRGSRSWVLPI